MRAPRATYEMQFGVAERPTHANTQADAAQFEVPAHRFGDLSEHGFGVALLTPDTHGMSAHGSTMRITLLRAPTDPDPEADQGEHEIRYAILPHRGGWQDAGVVAQARTFAEPLIPAAAGSGAFAEVDDPALVLDSIKRAEDSDALILRLYEAHGGRGTRAHPAGRAVLARLPDRPAGGRGRGAARSPATRSRSPTGRGS